MHCAGSSDGFGRLDNWGRALDDTRRSGAARQRAEGVAPIAGQARRAEQLGDLRIAEAQQQGGLERQR